MLNLYVLGGVLLAIFAVLDLGFKSQLSRFKKRSNFQVQAAFRVGLCVILSNVIAIPVTAFQRNGDF